jgi:hypothetical protein
VACGGRFFQSRSIKWDNMVERMEEWEKPIFEVEDVPLVSGLPKP